MFVRHALPVTILALSFVLLNYAQHTEEPETASGEDPTTTAALFNPWAAIREGGVYKETSWPQVYVIHSGKKIHIPTQSALFSMGYTWADVQVVPDGTLKAYPRFNIPSNSSTPGSLLYPPNRKAWFPLQGIPGSTRVVSRGKEIQITELYGWIRSYGCGDGTDFKYSFEVDTEWAVSKGIDLNRLWRAGNIAGVGHRQEGFSPRRAVARPIIELELNSWGRAEGDGKPLPSDWGTSSLCGHTYPFNQLQPDSSLDKINGDLGGGRLAYVRVSGSLVTDSPHDVQHRPNVFFSRWFAITTSDKAEWEGSVPDWHPGKESGDPSHYARWTEVHPPDLIEVQKDQKKQPNVGVRGVALAARVGALPFGMSNSCEAVDFTLAPEQQRPEPRSDWMIAYEERRGPETFFPWGQDANNGSWIDVNDDHIRVRARVCGGALFGSPGRFKAIYRVWWTPRPKLPPPVYGGIVRLNHVNTDCRLHSHFFNYGHAGSSRQQQITCFTGRDDNDDWIVKGPHGQGDDYLRGQPVKNGDIVRLEHRLTRRNLHSHSGHPSPVSRQQEITGFGENGSGDGNDNWRVEMIGASSLEKGFRFRLIHINTNHALHSHSGFSHPQWTKGQQEVTGFASRDDNDLWTLYD